MTTACRSALEPRGDRPPRFDAVCVFSGAGRHEVNDHHDVGFARQRFGASVWYTGAVGLRFVSPLWVDDVGCETRAGECRLTSVGTAWVGAAVPAWATTLMAAA